MIVAPLLIAAMNAPMPDFAVRLWSVLPADRGNVIVSPTSIEACLGLLIPAVGPSSRAPLTRVLGETDIETLQRRLHDLTTGGEVTVSNGFFSSEAPKPAYVAAILKGFGAKAERLQPGAAGLRQVNGWVDAATKGRIPKLFDRLVAPHAVLVNAVTFDGAWATPFPAEATAKADFKAPGGVRKVDLMHIPKLRVPYAQGAGFRMVQLPYAGGRYRMTVVLPDAGDPVALLRSNAWRPLPTETRSVDLWLPRFTLRSSPDVEGALKTMGLAPFFERIDLSLALPGGANDRIDQIVHKTYLQVDERGMKAAASTGVATMRAIVRPILPVAFRVDRPFAFVIQNVATGEAVFSGVVREP